MDISYLLFLQKFREGAGSFLTDFFLKMTFFGELNTVLIILAVIYWGISKSTGVFLLMGWSWTRTLNGFLKISFCAYRPWIRDPRIVPDPTAIITATGYSFPSGHSMNGGALFGGLAIRSKNRALRLFSLLMVVLIAFSRNFLGVHTPQDVLTGILLSPLAMFVIYRLLEKKRSGKRFMFRMAAVSIVFDLLLAVYAAFKQYPVDFDSTGSLLVDGMKMANDTFKGIGWNLGFFLGWIIEQKWICFQDPETKAQAAARIISGLLGFYIFNLCICPAVKQALGGAFGTTASCFLIVFYITALFPALIVIAERDHFLLFKKVL